MSAVPPKATKPRTCRVGRLSAIIYTAANKVRYSITSSARASRRWRHGEVQRPGRQEVDDEVKAGLVESPAQSSFPCPH